MNSVHDKEYKTQLSDFFRNLGEEVDDSINIYKVELTNFFASLRPAVDIATRAQAELDRIAATRFSVFGYFRERETDLSRIFADLLDPSGSHGQGDSFLRLFVAELTRQENGWPNKLGGVLPNVSLDGCKTHLEFWTGKGGGSDEKKGRIDIVLEIPYEEFWIGIENKPWAGDQKGQISHYLDTLRKKSRKKNARMLYLSGDGTEPSEDAWEGSDDKKRDRSLCLTIPYRQNSDERLSLENWLQQCWEQCEAERVRWFLKDLLEYIKSQFENSAHTEPENGENKA